MEKSGTRPKYLNGLVLLNFLHISTDKTHSKLVFSSLSDPFLNLN